MMVRNLGINAMEIGKLVVLGSINAGHILNIEHFTQPG